MKTKNDREERLKAGGVDESMVERIRRARKEGRLQVGGLDIEPTSEEDLADLEVEGKLYNQGPKRGIPVIIRLQPEAMEWLREEADQIGVRGWRVLLRQRIEAMLGGEAKTARS